MVVPSVAGEEQANLRQWPGSLLLCLPSTGYDGRRGAAQVPGGVGYQMVGSPAGPRSNAVSGHSLWRGGATSAAAAGLSPAVIQQMGGWRSDT